MPPDQMKRPQENAQPDIRFWAKRLCGRSRASAVAMLHELKTSGMDDIAWLLACRYGCDVGEEVLGTARGGA